MKTKKRIRTLAAALLTGAMAVSMGGMSALAAVEPVESVTLKKTVTTDGNTYAPKTSFEFSVNTAGAGSFDNKTVSAGIEGGLTVSSIAFEPQDEDVKVSEIVKNGTLTVNGNVFTTPGIYHYTISETAGSYEGIKYDNAVYDAYVYVVNDDTRVAVEAVVFAKGGSKANELSFVNDYGKDDDNDTTHDVTITKAVTGNQGEKNREFTFTAAVAGDEGEWYKVVKTAQDGTTTESKLVSGGDALEYKLKDGESIHIYGLSENDTYTVVETDANKDGYTTTASGELSGKLTADGTSVMVTNNREVSPATGIALTFAPYILMVALAGVFAVLFLRKKREEF